jgi:hypothetical protein
MTPVRKRLLYTGFECLNKTWKDSRNRTGQIFHATEAVFVNMEMWMKVFSNTKTWNILMGYRISSECLRLTKTTCLLVCEHLKLTLDRRLGYDVILGKPPMYILADISIWRTKHFTIQEPHEHVGGSCLTRISTLHSRNLPFRTQHRRSIVRFLTIL